MVPFPLLKAYRLLDKIEFDSSHQSNLFWNMYSKTLRKSEERAMRSEKCRRVRFGCGNNFKDCPGIRFFFFWRKICFRVIMRRSRALDDSIMGEMLS